MKTLLAVSAFAIVFGRCPACECGRQGHRLQTGLQNSPAGRWSTSTPPAEAWCVAITDRRCRSGSPRKGLGLTAGKWKIDNGKGRFSDVHDIREVYGNYAQASASAGVVKSAETQLLSKGNVSLALAAAAKASISAWKWARSTSSRSADATRMTRRRPSGRRFSCAMRGKSIASDSIPRTVAIRCGLPGPDDGRDTAFHPRPAPAQHPGHAGRGRAVRVDGCGLKTLSGRYPPFQVATLRGAASLPLVLAWSLATVGWRSLLRVRWPLHLLRGAIGVMMMATFVYALKRMPLSTAYTIFFVAPLLITAMSVPFLGERVGPRRWTAIAIGLLGVLVVLRPSGEGMASLAGLAVLIAAFGTRSRPSPCACSRAAIPTRRW